MGQEYATGLVPDKRFGLIGPDACSAARADGGLVGRHGGVRRIHNGFAGPATGVHHERLVAKMEGLIEELLDQPAPDRR